MLAPRAVADEFTCSRVRVSAGPGLDSGWQDAIAALREQVARLGEAECPDLSMLVARDPGRGGARIVVSAPDGRRAERPVAEAASLSSVAMGILATIPPEAPAASSAEPTPQELPPPDETPFRPPPPPLPPPPATLAASLGGRMGFPTGVLAPELELRGDIRIDGWIVSLAGRGAPTGTRPFAAAIPGFDHKEFSFGVSGGRRFDLGVGVLDVTAGPRVGIITEEGDVPSDGTGGTLTDPWLEAALRLAIGRSARWRPTVALELDAAPGRLAMPGRVDDGLPALPSWSIGVHVGVAGDVP